MNKQFLIYLDLDGVLANFDKLILELFETYYKKYYFVEGIISIDKIPYETKQEMIRKYNARGGNFYLELELFHCSELLVKHCLYIPNTEVQILTSIGFGKTAEDTYKQKCAWVKKHFGDLKVNAVNSGAQKAKFSAVNSILIDDSKTAVDAFNAKYPHGIGLLFNNKNKHEWVYMTKYITNIISGVNYE